MIIDDIKETIERPLAEQRRQDLGTMTASQVKALFNLLPDAAWLQIADFMVKNEPANLGDYLIATHKTYVMQTAQTDVNALFVADAVSQQAIVTLIG